jgi:metallo-beta-lactamase family protein
VYVDSPLAIDATEIFRMYPEAYNDDVRRVIERDHDPFGFRRLQFVRDVEESKRLDSTSQPMVIISASGMAEFGRIRHHLANGIENPRNTVLLVGFQAENTLGRRLAEGARKVRIFDEERQVRARVETIDGFSAHADRNELLAWVAAARGRLRRVFVVHGEEASALALAAGIRALGAANVDVPRAGDSVEL